uniref:Uncharacterized protein n=1 Tax=Eptatretus burgeri TaxID=7764 RepID=A0A8C4R0P7_EPTBU
MGDQMKRSTEMSNSARFHQQRRLKQAMQFYHKDSADLLPLDSLKKLEAVSERICSQLALTLHTCYLQVKPGVCLRSYGLEFEPCQPLNGHQVGLTQRVILPTCPALSDDPEESPRHKTLRTENFTAWSMNRDPLLK